MADLEKIFRVHAIFDWRDRRAQGDFGVITGAQEKNFRVHLTYSANWCGSIFIPDIPAPGLPVGRDPNFSEFPRVGKKIVVNAPGSGKKLLWTPEGRE